MNFHELYAQIGQYYDTGYAQLSRPITLLSTPLLLVGVWRTTLEYYNIPILQLLVGMAGSLLVLFIVWGYHCYHSGIVQKTIDMANDQNKQWQELRKEIGEIKRLLE